MINLKRTITIVLMLAISAVAVLTLQAQDATETPADMDAEMTEESVTTPIICESSLILLVGLAQRDYGYVPTYDVNQFQQGQYADYFNNTQDNADMDSEATEEVPVLMTATPEVTTEAEGDLSDGTVTLLEPPLVVNEDTRCTELRQGVEEFFTTTRESNNTMGSNSE